MGQSSSSFQKTSENFQVIATETFESTINNLQNKVNSLYITVQKLEEMLMSKAPQVKSLEINKKEKFEEIQREIFKVMAELDNTVQNFDTLFEGLTVKHLKQNRYLRENLETLKQDKTESLARFDADMLKISKENLELQKKVKESTVTITKLMQSKKEIEEMASELMKKLDYLRTQSRNAKEEFDMYKFQKERQISNITRSLKETKDEVHVKQKTIEHLMKKQEKLLLTKTKDPHNGKLYFVILLLLILLMIKLTKFSIFKLIKNMLFKK